MSSKTSKEATSNEKPTVSIGNASQQELKRARVESHDSNKDRVSDKRSAKLSKKQEKRLLPVQSVLKSLPEKDILHDRCKSLASDALSSAICLKIQTMIDQLHNDKVPSTIHYHETFVPTYKKPNKDIWQSSFDKLHEKIRQSFDAEKDLTPRYVCRQKKWN